MKEILALNASFDNYILQWYTLMILNNDIEIRAIHTVI